MTSQQLQQENCSCAEMTCQKDCAKNHTHKTFWCEKCSPKIVEEHQKYAVKYIKYKDAYLEYVEKNNRDRENEVAKINFQFDTALGAIENMLVKEDSFYKNVIPRFRKNDN